MTHLPTHTVVDCEDDKICAYVHPASAESVLTVLAADPDNDDGRSQPVWVRLPNGDLILGVYPQGETYLAVEIDATFPGNAT